MPYLSELDVRVVGGGNYKVLRAFLYQLPGSRIITVPPGFITDFASIPRAFRWLVTGHGSTRKPAVVHDYLVRKKLVERKEADKIFLVAMEEAGVSAWKRWICYGAVRAMTEALRLLSLA